MYIKEFYRQRVFVEPTNRVRHSVKVVHTNSMLLKHFYTRIIVKRIGNPV